MRKKISKYLLNFYIIGLLIAANFSFVNSAYAANASLYLAPSSGTKVIGSSFNVAVKVNTGGDVINASQGSISYDTGLLQAVSVSRGGSIFNLWTAEPAISGGSINFGGGVPQPGYSGSAGTIFTINFKAIKVGTAQIRFTSGAVLANDGKGTNILASMGSASFTISPAAAAPKPTPSETTTPEPVIEREYNKPVIESETHPDQDKWYKQNTVKFNWELPSGVNGVSITFDEKEVADPGPVSDGLFSDKTYENAEDGVWYLHLKFKDNNRWGTTAHYRVMIDTKPPQPFEIKIEEKEPGDWPILRFKAEDDGSGIAKYEVIIGNLEDAAIEIKDLEDPHYEVSGLDVGDHTALVKAVDKAGNETVATAKFSVAPIEAPKIINYPGEIKSSDKFYMNGTALKGVAIDVFIKQGDRLITEDNITSDQNGNWFYITDQTFTNGRYVVWVEAVNDKGIKSGPSEQISFLVSPPIFARIGNFVINYFTVFVSLLFIVILIILLILWLVALFRRRVKKETIEVEQIVKKNFAALEKSIDNDLTQLSKHKGKASFSNELAKTKTKIKGDIKTAEKQILKEIKDVEDLLK
jgi:hypothetical protein